MIQVFVTGGTMDKVYDVISGEHSFSLTHAQELLATARVQLDIHVETLMLVDSRQLKDDDRAKILHEVITSKAAKIIITHGTDTMCQTAEYLQKHLKNSDKTTVLTGAMVPFYAHKNDVLFNLGTAIAFVQSLKNGVYIAMNGKAFRAGEVRKNTHLGIFESIFENSHSQNTQPLTL